MQGGNSAGIVIPLIGLSACTGAFIFTLKSIRLLKSIFISSKFHQSDAFEVQIRYRSSIKNIFKRISPIYGAFQYNSVQYDMPPAAHIFQVLVYWQLIWGVDYLIAAAYQEVSYGFSVLAGVVTTVISMILCFFMHDSFIRSFNAKKIEEIKVIDNSTILDGRINNSDKHMYYEKDIVVIIVISCMLALIGNFCSFFSSTTATEDLFLFALIQSLISCTLDLPLRLLACKIIQKTNYYIQYETIFTPLIVNANKKDISLLRVKDFFIEEISENSAQQEVSVPLDVSANFSPKRLKIVEEYYSPKRCLKVEPTVIVPRMSQNAESEPEEERSEKPESERSYDTLASHNVVSEDENIQQPLLFPHIPLARSPLKSQHASPQKYSSPKKASSKPTALFDLIPVSMDYEPNAESSKDFIDQSISFFRSGANKSTIKEEDEVYIEGRFDLKKKQRYDDPFEESLVLIGGEIEESYLVRDETNEGCEVKEIVNEDIRMFVEEEQEEFYSKKPEEYEEEEEEEKNENEKEEEKEKEEVKVRPESKNKEYENVEVNSKLHLKQLSGGSIHDSLDRSYNPPNYDDYKADMSESEIPVKSPTKYPKKTLKSMLKASLVRNDLNIFPPIERPKPPKKPSVDVENLQKYSKKSISLHRKLISFEEDLEIYQKPPSNTHQISPLNILANPETIDFRETFQLSPPPVQQPAILTTSPLPSTHALAEINEGPKSDALNRPPPSKPPKPTSPHYKVSSSSSSSLSAGPKLSKGSSKKIIMQKPFADSALEDIFTKEQTGRARSKSSNNRASSKPPSRPSKSREREVITSGEFHMQSKPDIGFIKKITEKDLVKDKAVFVKKSTRKIMKHLEKLLEGKENDEEDPEIVRLKNMLASRQSFKKKHVDLPKDHPYNQRISMVMSDGSTPQEEFRIDPEALKKREERLKRISSIYSQKKGKGKSGKTKDNIVLSPSKSENLIKRKNNYL